MVCFDGAEYWDEKTVRMTCQCHWVEGGMLLDKSICMKRETYFMITSFEVNTSIMWMQNDPQRLKRVARCNSRWKSRATYLTIELFSSHNENDFSWILIRQIFKWFSWAEWNMSAYGNNIHPDALSEFQWHDSLSS